MLPFASVDAEISGRAPQPDSSLSADAAHWKVGAGAGVEFPLLFKKLLLRADYAYEEFDDAPFIATIKGDIIQDTPPSVTVTRDRNRASVGIAFLSGSNVAFEGSYSFAFWQITEGSLLDEMHTSQRVLISIATRF